MISLHNIGQLYCCVSVIIYYIVYLVQNPWISTTAQSGLAGSGQDLDISGKTSETPKGNILAILMISEEFIYFIFI